MGLAAALFCAGCASQQDTIRQEQDKLDKVRDQLGEFADAMNESRELQVFLFSPYFSTKEKVEGLDKAVSGFRIVTVNGDKINQQWYSLAEVPNQVETK